MSHPVTTVTPAQAEAQPTVVRPKPPEAKLQSVPTDTVHISTAAVAALNEASKAHLQTSQQAKAEAPQTIKPGKKG